MKKFIIKSYLFSVLLLMGSSLFSMMPFYQAKITSIHEIQGVTTYTLVIKCDQREPIMVYAPSTYQESLDDTLLRFFLPNCSFADGVSPIVGTVENVGTGIEILLFGKMLTKVVSNGLISITIQVK